MSVRSVHGSLRLASLTVIVSAGCRPSEPPPTHYEDLGNEERALLPTSSAWHDTSVVKGSADWHPFRKPEADAKPAQPSQGPSAGAAAEGKVAGEIRELVNEFNGVVAEGKFDEAVDFLIEEQIAPAKQVVEVLPQFAAKLAELAAALPGDNENLKKVAVALTLASVLKLDVTSIEAKGESAAVGKPAADGREVRFVLVKEEEGEFWYIDHPLVRAMGPSLPALQQSLQQFDAMVAGIRSGQISEEMAGQQAAALNQMLAALIPSGGSAGGGEGESPGEAKPVAEDEPADEKNDEGN